ncbi:D-alanyl-D-alanine carboxypeptidase family protein [Actinotalea sp. AC32]|nr:D-alanyl-D-alanine carboxypeptidase family protein [Actinotalea sp. AC32]
MTQQVEAPLTRRALRAPAPPRGQGDAAPHATSPTPTAPRTRREIRLAELAALGGNAVLVAPRESADAPVVEPTWPAVAAAARTEQPDAAGTPVDAPAAADERPLPTSGDRPLTRREIRLAEQERARQEQEREAERARLARAAACRPPFVPSLVVSSRDGVRQLSDRASGLLASLVRGGVRPVAVVAVSAGLLVAGVSQVQAEQSVLRTAMEQAQAALTEQSRLDRASQAATDRLNAQAAAYASARRTEAVEAASVAVQTAQGVKEVAAPVVDEATLASLEAAAAELEALLAQTAVPVDEQATVPSTDDVTTTSNDVSAAEQPGTSEEAGAAEAPTEPTEPQGPADPTDDAGTAEQPAEQDSGSEPDEDGATSVPRSASASRSAERPELSDDEAGEVVALDLEVTEQILAAAQQVTQLSAEVKATADAKIAEAQAAAAAEAAARAAAEAAAAELQRKVDLARSADNGEIPAEALCGVGFASGVQLRCDAAAALETLNAAYRADFGRDLEVVSSYRSYGAQVTTKQARGYLAAQPGTSNHGLGIAVDFGDFGGVGNFGTANYRWMKANSERFGWHHPRIMEPGGGGPQEPWHWEFGTTD